MTADISQIIEIPLGQILLNDKNPRGFINQAAVNTLSASMAVEGQKDEVKLRLLETGQYMVVGGDHRVLAARKLGWTTIRAIVLDINPKQVFLAAYLDNQGQPMGWYADYMAIEAAWAEGIPGQVTQKAVADRLMLDDSRVGKALKLLPLLSFKARQAILVNYQKAVGYLIPESCALCLRDLDTGSPVDQGVIEAAIQVVIDRQMTKAQVQKLVAWIKKGNSPESFPASGKTEVQKGSKNQRFDPNDPLADIWKELPKGAKIHKTPKGYQLSWKLSEVEAPLAVKGALAGLAGTKGENPNPTVADTSQPLSPVASSTKVYMFRDWVAGVKIIPQLKHKVEKGETLTFAEVMVLGSYRIGQGIHWVSKEWIKPSLEKLEKTFGKTLYYIFIALLLCCVAWKVWPVFQGVLHPIRWIESKFHHDQTESNTPVSTPKPVVSNIVSLANSAAVHLKPKPTSVPTPLMAYQPAISFQPTVEDPKVLDLEIAAFSDNSVSKDFPVAPDEGMPVDLATSRMQDLTDADKYTMMIGGGKQIILSVITNNSTLTIHYKSTDPFGKLFGDNGQMNIFWEDVKAIHVSEIDVQSKNPTVTYQFSLIADGAKYPFSIQCATAENLEHLVSTMEYFIRNSRLGHDTALTGMPYPSQGLVLTNDCLVNKLWADSPMDKAGVKLGDMIWSLEKNTQIPQERKDLETQLAAMGPGQHSFYVANNADFTQAQGDVAFHRASSLNPKRKKMYLQL